MRNDKVSNKLDTIRKSRENLRQELESAGAKFTASGICCPFHEDHHPSAGIYQGKDGIFRFKCQASECAFGGDVFDVRARATGKPLAEVLLAAIGNNHQKKQTTQRQSESENKIYHNLDSLRAALPGEVVLQHDYLNPVTGQPDLLVFRCQLNGENSYRPAYPTKGGFRLAAPPKPWPLYARDAIADSDTVIVVEGEKCCDVLSEYGISATTNAFGAGKAEHADWTPLAGKNLILWPDHDVVGHNHMRQIQTILDTLDPKPRVAWLEPRDLDLQEREDAADFIEQLKTLEKSQTKIETELRQVIGKARPLGPLDKLHQRIKAINAGEYRCIAWPWSMLSNLTKALLPGTITLLAGTVGASKSFMLLQAVLFWLYQREHIAYYVLEGDRPFHLARALAQLSGIAGFTDPDWIKENPLAAQAALIEHTEQLELFAHHLWASDNLGAETLEQLAEWIAQQAKLSRRIICIDPVTAAARTGKPWVVDLAFLKAVKKTAVDYNCSVVLVTHPTKDTAEPNLQNLAGAAAYQRFTDVIITLRNHESQTSCVKTAVGRTEVEHTRTVRIEKARNGSGTGYSLAFSFNTDFLTLTEHGVITKG